MRSTVLVSTAAAALALGVTEAAVRKLAERGKLTRYGSPQRALYDRGQLDDLDQQRRENASRRKKNEPVSEIT